MKKILLSIICVASASVFAQKPELVFFEDFENPEMPAFVEYAKVDVSGKHTTNNAISGSGSLEVNTLGKVGYPLTLRLNTEKIVSSKIQSSWVSISFKYKVLGAGKNNETRNYLLGEMNGKRVFGKRS